MKGFLSSMFLPFFFEGFKQVLCRHYVNDSLLLSDITSVKTAVAVFVFHRHFQSERKYHCLLLTFCL